MRGLLQVVLAVCILLSVQLLVIGAVSAAGFNFGTTTCANISSLNENDTYSFSATAKDMVFVKLKGDWINTPQVAVYLPNGSPLTTVNAYWWTNWLEFNKQLPVSGSYNLVVRDAEGDNTSGYCLYVQQTNRPGHAVLLSYAATQADTISKFAQMNNYTIRANAKDVVFAKLRGDWTGTPQIRVYLPNGSPLSTVSASYYSNWLELTQALPVAGNYTLLAGDAEGDTTGNYWLYLQRTNNAPKAVPLSYGVTEGDSVSKFAQMNNYSFQANAKDVVFGKMRTTWTGTPQVRLFLPNGSPLGTVNANYYANWLEFTKVLPVAGTYTLLAGDSEGDTTGKYWIYLQRTNNASRTFPLSYGTTREDSVSKYAQMNNYTFPANAKDVIYTKMRTTWTGTPQIRIFLPNGTPLSTTNAGYSANWLELTQALPVAGNYTLLAGDAEGDSTGKYWIYIQRTSNASRTVPLSYGTTREDSVTRYAQMNNYTFQANAKDVVFAKMRGVWTGTPQLRLYLPNGTQAKVVSAGYGSNWLELTQALPVAGNYTLLAGDAEGDSTGKYWLYIQRPNNASRTVPLSWGVTRNDSVTKFAQMNNYTFQANAKDVFYAKMRATWTGYPQLRLYLPNGTPLSSTNAGYGANWLELTQALPVAGTYTLLAGDAEGDTIGSYWLYVQRPNNASRTVPLSYGITRTDSVSKFAQMNNYTFSVLADDIIYARLKADWTGTPQIRIYLPNGTALSVTNANYYANWVEVTQKIPVAGTCTLLAGDAEGDSTGGYSIYIQRTNNASRTVPLSYGVTLADSVSKYAQMNNYTIQAVAKDVIYAKVRATWTGYPQVRVYLPNGTPLSTTSAGYGANWLELTQPLPVTGKYTILAGDAEGDTTGSYWFYIQRTSSPARTVPLTYGATRADSISKFAQMNNYTFAASADDTVYVKLKASWTGTPQVRIYLPNGTALSVTNANYYANWLELTQRLPVSGTYTLLAGDSEGDTTGSYTVYIQRTNNPTGALAIVTGTNRTDSIDTEAQLNSYQFDGTSGQSITMRMKAGWTNTPQIRLYLPNGTTLGPYNAGWGADFFQFTRDLPVSGTYTVLAGDAEGDSSGSYWITLD